MPQMINVGNEILRINPAKNTIEYSTNQGRTWANRYTSSYYGAFIDLLQYGAEVLAVTTKGVMYSTNQGRTWAARYIGSSYGDFQNIMDGGRELLANTSKGLFFSTNAGRTWARRR